MDVDTQTINITWSLSPGYLFSGTISGSGKTVTITPSTYSGTGKLTYNFQMPGGESFSAEKTFGVKGPKFEDISFFVCNSDGITTNNIGGTWLMCPNTTYHIYVNNDGPCSTSNYSWTVPNDWTTHYTWQNMISVNTNSFPGGNVVVNANTCCNNNITILSDYMGEDYDCGYYLLSFFPNPTTGETTLSIETTSEDKKLDKNAEWDLEVYDQMQMLKAKKVKLKGSTYVIDTSGWKEGVYFVLVNYKDGILHGKLMVK